MEADEWPPLGLVGRRPAVVPVRGGKKKSAREVWIVLDADGYQTGDRMRMRELAWTWKTSSADCEWKTESAFFTDAEGVAPLSKLDSNVDMAYKKCHGLRLNPSFGYWNSLCWNDPSIDIHPDSYDLSPAAATWIRLVGDAASCVFLHKGGPEGRWLRDRKWPFVVQVIDLADLGCARIDGLPVSAQCRALQCGGHWAEEAARRDCNHCPRVETRAFADWWASTGRLRSLLFAVLLRLDLVLLVQRY